MSGNTQFDYSWQQYPIKDLSGGLNVDTAIVNPNELSVADNVDLLKYGAAAKRGGYRKCHATAITVANPGLGIRSLYNYSKNTNGVRSDVLLAVHGATLLAGVPSTSKLLFGSFTSLSTALNATDRHSFATLCNRVIISSINDRLWTNGVAVRNNGLAAPATSVTATPATSGGSIPDGVYKVSYSYLMSGNFEYETNASAQVSCTVTGGGGSGKITVGVTASADAQVDKIRIYISSAGGSMGYYQAEVANTTGSTAITTLLTGVEAPFDNNVPPKAKFVLTKGNMVFYGYTDDTAIGSSLVRWSAINDPHSCPSANWAMFNAEDGDEIVGLGEILNYVVVFKRRSIFLLDVDTFSKTQVNQEGGALSNGSISTILGGNALMYHSDEGVMIFDGQQSTPITKNKINTLVCANVDKDNCPAYTMSSYSPEKRRYSIYIPMADSSYLWLNFFLDAKGWTLYKNITPTAFGNAFDDDGRNVQLFAVKSGTDAFICQADYAYADDTAAIQMAIKTVSHNMGMDGLTKQVRRCYLDWYAASATNATFSVKVDYGSRAGVSKDISHGGSVNWGYFYWGQSYWGQSGRETDRIDLKGKGLGYEFSFTESSTTSVIVYGMTISYYPLAYQGTID
jgi:hypothetical protein